MTIGKKVNEELEGEAKGTTSAASTVQDVKDNYSLELTNKLLDILSDSFSNPETPVKIRRGAMWITEKYEDDEEIFKNYLNTLNQFLETEHSQSEVLTREVAEATESIALKADENKESLSYLLDEVKELGVTKEAYKKARDYTKIV